jgi:hypothetical protein
MPKLSQLMVRAALIWLGLGYTIGALSLFHKALPLFPWLATLRLSHVAILFIGWTMQLACGVAFWILPRLDATGNRGDERPVWVCFVSLNLGVALDAGLGPLSFWLNQPLNTWMPAIIAGCYLIATVSFIWHAWRRVLPFRTVPRPNALR